MTAALAVLVAEDALRIATDYGQRSWADGMKPELTRNAFGGCDLTQAGTTFRTSSGDGDAVTLAVFTGGSRMLLVEEATMTSGLAHLVSQHVAAAIR